MGIAITVRDYMTREVVTALASDSLAHVRRLMLRHGISRVVVIDERTKPKGIFTQRDFSRLLLRGLEVKRDLDSVSVGEVMTRRLVTCFPEEGMSGVARMMLNNAISSVVVVDKGHKLVGIITKTDICRFFAERCRELFTVKDAMTRNVITVRRANSAAKAIALMTKYGVSRVVAIEGGKPVGIVTLKDLMFSSPHLIEKYYTAKHDKYKRLRSGEGRFKVALIPLVEDMMTEDPITVTEAEDLSTACSLMLERGISGLPVVSEEGILLGIVTKTDVTRVVATMMGA